VALSATVPHDAAYRPKIPAIAASYAAMARLCATTGSAEARDWYRKSLALWDELAASRVSAHYIQQRRKPVEAALTEWERRSGRFQLKLSGS
jgi:hypothetical protein